MFKNNFGVTQITTQYEMDLKHNFYIWYFKTSLPTNALVLYNVLEFDKCVLNNDSSFLFALLKISKWTHNSWNMFYLFFNGLFCFVLFCFCFDEVFFFDEMNLTCTRQWWVPKWRWTLISSNVSKMESIKTSMNPNSIQWMQNGINQDKHI